jgi:hypothetical protein
MKNSNNKKEETSLLNALSSIGKEIENNKTCSNDNPKIDLSKYDNIASAEVLYQYFIQKSDIINLSNFDKLKLPKELELCTNISSINISNNSFYDNNKIDINFTKLPKLKSIDLSCCNLSGFDCSINGLDNLFELNLLGAKFYRNIPLSIQFLLEKIKKLSITIDELGGADFSPLEYSTQLEYLKIQYFDRFINLSRLVNLKTLIIETYLSEEFNHSILSIKSLEELNIFDAPNLTTLPNKLVEMPNLKSIYITGSRIQSIPDIFKNSNIDVNIELHTKLNNFTPFILREKEVKATCKNDSISSNIIKYQHKVLKTKHLNLSYLGNMVIPKSLKYCTDIESLNLSNNTFHGGYLDLRRNKKLKFIDLSCCYLWDTKFNLTGLNDLFEIDLSDTQISTPHINELIILPKKLSINFIVNHNFQWENNFSIENCTHLEILKIDVLNQDLDLSKLTELRILEVDYFAGYNFNTTLFDLNKLEKLEINKAPNLAEIPRELLKLSGLKLIHIANSKIKTIPKELKDSKIKIAIN